MFGRELRRGEKAYLPEFVYGGIDGAITTFAVVSGAIGASLSPAIILILGFANLIADGFSMSVSNYLSTKSQAELHVKHKDYKEFKKLAGHPVKNGLATFISFIIIGFIPLFSFVLAIAFPSLKENQFLYSIILTAIALFVVGLIKGKIVKKHPIRAALETLLIGGIAAILAFAVGFIAKVIIS